MVHSRILVTGGAGFIGSAFVRQAVLRGLDVVVVDCLTYAGDLARIREVSKKIKFYKVDIASDKQLEIIFKKEKINCLVHFAAETHVDRSLKDISPFIRTNVLGTQNLIDLAIKHRLKSFLHISTDEVYGQGQKGLFKETDPLKPHNPYAVTKAAGELLVRTAIQLFQFPAIIIRSSNIYGPWQHPEKLIPVVISNAFEDKKIPVYGKGLQIREWLHVDDCISGIFQILKKGQEGEIYNLGSNFESRNIDSVKTILTLMGKKNSLIKFVPDRLGHDFRYSLNCLKISQLGFRPQISFKEGLVRTIDWYKDNNSWVKKKNFYQ